MLHAKLQAAALAAHSTKPQSSTLRLGLKQNHNCIKSHQKANKTRTVPQFTITSCYQAYGNIHTWRTEGKKNSSQLQASKKSWKLKTANRSDFIQNIQGTAKGAGQVMLETRYLY